jgi:hypothetical protein
MLGQMFRHLQDEIRRARLVALRESVKPILANNLLPYFTAHDVEHCDRVTGVIDAFIEPLQASENRLNSQELFAVYAAAYLHDVGMHYERVGDSPSLREPLRTRPWDSLTPDERRDLLRQHHPRISAELVLASVRNASPPIGLQLTDDDGPGPIATLCEAHGIDPSTQRFKDLMVDGPGIRTRLLTGILRCADILEESRRRANRARAESLLLPLESQVHWWRHYYTADITFNQTQRTIEVWFEFPANRRPELERIVPELQLPEVRTELDRHQQTFVPNNLTWFVQSRVSPHETAEDIPEPVLREMLLTIARRRERDAEERRRALALVYDEARPQLERRLELLRQQEPNLSPKSIADGLRELADDMASFGAAASARSLMREAFGKAENADIETRLSVGLRLGKMLVDSKNFDEAVRLYERLLPLMSSSAEHNSRLVSFWNTKIDAEIRAGFFENAVESMKGRRQVLTASDPFEDSRLAEISFFQGTP